MHTFGFRVHMSSSLNVISEKLVGVEKEVKTVANDILNNYRYFSYTEE